MPVKLKEMDDVVDEIYKNTLSSSTLIFITGDHGMQDAGGMNSNYMVHIS